MPRFLASSDAHLTMLRPRCRIDDDWLGFQKNILSFIAKEANKRKCEVHHYGDLFDTAKVPDIIKTMFLEFAFSINKGIRVLAGNHSLPYHAWENVSDSSFGIIDEIVKSNNDKIKYFDDIGMYSHFNEEMKGTETGLVFLHRLTFEKAKDMPPNIKASSAQDLLDKYPDSKYIFVGDMHKAFVYEKKGRYVINPGALFKSSADEKNYKPSIYFVDTDNDKIEQIFLPDVGEVVDDSYLRNEEEKVSRIEAFVEGIKKNGKISLSFLDNLESAIQKNKSLDGETIKVIRELCEEKEE
jgi:DNA repair exonuclease SbcCD nuclease subunit